MEIDIVIDIIDLTEPQYANLSPVQLSFVRDAQVKKNKLVAAAEREKLQLTNKLVCHHFSDSFVHTLKQEEIDANLNRDVEFIRANLIYELAYKTTGEEGNENGPYRYPENPNYNLTYSQRFFVVYDYYMQLTKNAQLRLDTLAKDSLARAYLSTYYDILYDMFVSDAKK